MVAEAKAEIAACIAMMKLKQEMIVAWEAQIHLKQSILSSLEAHAAHAGAGSGAGTGALEHPHPHKKASPVFAAPPPSAPPPPPTPSPPRAPPPTYVQCTFIYPEQSTAPNAACCCPPLRSRKTKCAAPPLFV
mgnify:CR=1 FL=1